MHRNPGTTAKLVALAEEALASVALHDQPLLLITELVPQRMKFGIVWTMDDMCQFVQHSVSHLLYWQELSPVAWMTQPQENSNSLTLIDVQA